MRDRGAAVFVLPTIRDECFPEEKNALAARNACAVEGRCPECGCVGYVEPIMDGVFRYAFEHEDGCAVLATVEVPR